MARRTRDDAPGAAHHVMLRGVDRCPIFLDHADREDFLRRLSLLVPALGFHCFAWALMPNHVHLVLRSGQARISQLMARLGTGYARYFNERHGRVGHLFQNRFRSRLAEDDADLMGLVLYVTRNPLEAGLVEDAAELERYVWCGLGSLMGRRPERPFESVSESLALFDADPARAREGLRGRLRTAEPRGTPAPACAPAAQRALVRLPHPEFEELMRQVCVRFGVTADELRSRGRSQLLAAARSSLARRAAADLGLAGAEIARQLGMTKAAVSVMLARRAVDTANNLTF
jgi:REP element-mobilizing transposase RayT